MQTQDNSQAASTADSGERAEVVQTGFGSRGRARRRVRFLRKARELAYRDLGGLVFNLHRFGQRNDALVLAKLTTLGHIDNELRTIEAALGEREPVTVLREAGITACPRCAAIHSSEDRFCPNCGLSMSRHVDLPVAGAASAPSAPTPAAPTPPATSAPVPPAFPTPQPSAPASAAHTLAPAPAPATPPPAETHTPVPAHKPADDVPAPAPSPSAAQSSPEASAASSTEISSKDEATEIIHPVHPGAPGS
jgi:hypothetical protein